MTETVLFESNSMTEAQQELARRACELAGVTAVNLSLLDSKEKLVRAAPSLLVAGLALGERQVPSDVAKVAGEVLPGLPLLLLCSERLVRPALTLPDGRVTMLGAPLELRSLASRIRTSLSVAPVRGGSRKTKGRSKPHSYERCGLSVNELRHDRIWAAAYERSSGAYQSTQKLALSETVLTGVLEPGPSASDEGRNSENEVTRVELELGLPRWTAAFGSGTSAWLLSPTRAPKAWNLAAHGKKAVLKASEGDVFVLARGLADWQEDQRSEGPSSELLELASAGAPALADFILSKAGQERPFAAIFVEIR